MESLKAVQAMSSRLDSQITLQLIGISYYYDNLSLVFSVFFVLIRVA